MLYKVVGDTKCFADNKAQENQILIIKWKNIKLTIKLFEYYYDLENLI